MLVYAVNLENADDVCPEGGGNWLDYYRERMDMMGMPRYPERVLGGLCPACWSNPIEIGAVMGFLSWKNRRAYVVPLCRSCSRRQGRIGLPSYLMCVPLPNSVLQQGALRYPQECMALFSLQCPQEVSTWDGRPSCC